MKRYTKWVRISGILLLVLGTWKCNKSIDTRIVELQPNSNASESTAPTSVPSKGSAGTSSPGYAEFAAAHLTPIIFYGKVLDHDGAPVADATITYRANNIPWGGGTRSQIKSNANGEFTLSSRGLSLFVEASKDGYRSLPRRSDVAPGAVEVGPKSSGTFAYAKLFAETSHKPDKTAPVIFTLHKSGELEPLISPYGKDVIMPKDGSPVQVQLNQGNPITTVEMRCWTEDKQPNEERHYNWRFKVTIPSGGLVERPDEIAFVAPESGYEKTFEYSMDKALLGNQWKYDVRKSFFVRFDDNTHAIFDVRMTTGGDHFAAVKWHFNPKTGSRNLETAPPKKPKYR